MKTWFEKKFSTTEWWETRLKNVAKTLGLEISFASCYLAHRAKEQHFNWRCTDSWHKHLDYIAKYGYDF